MKIIGKISLGLVLLLSASVAFAGTNNTAKTPYNEHQGVYIGANAGASFGGNGAAGPAFGADIGYQFNRNFALEIGGNYAWPFGANADANFVPNIFGENVNINLYGANLAAKAILPLGNRFSLFVKGGPALVVMHTSWSGKLGNGSSTTTKPAVFLAGGAAVAITHHLAVDMQVGGNIFSGGAYGLSGLGLTYHFG